jgi:hypothetical protein
MEQKERLLSILGIYGGWLILTVLTTFTLLQVHATLIFLGLTAVQNPATTIPGWNTYTIYGLSRFLYLLLGIIWLFAVMYYYGLLQEAQKPKKLWFYLRRITVVLLVLYAFSYAILWMLSTLQK